MTILSVLDEVGSKRGANFFWYSQTSFRMTSKIGSPKSSKILSFLHWAHAQPKPVKNGFFKEFQSKPHLHVFQKLCKERFEFTISYYNT